MSATWQRRRSGRNPAHQQHVAAARQQRGRQLQRLLGHVFGVESASARLRLQQRAENALAIVVLRREHGVAVRPRGAGDAQVVRIQRLVHNLRCALRVASRRRVSASGFRRRAARWRLVRLRMRLRSREAACRCAAFTASRRALVSERCAKEYMRLTAPSRSTGVGASTGAQPTVRVAVRRYHTPQRTWCSGSAAPTRRSGSAGC